MANVDCARFHFGVRNRFYRSNIEDEKAQQGARANDHGCHAACFLTDIEMKLWNLDRHEARGAPATVVAHL